MANARAKFLQKAKTSQTDPEAWKAQAASEQAELKRRAEEHAEKGRIEMQEANQSFEVQKEKVKEEEEVRRQGQMQFIGFDIDEEREEFWVFQEGEVELCVKIAMPKPSTIEGAKLPCCAVFIPGMPQKAFGNARMDDPLPSLILKKCWEIGLPTIRFDFTGCGKSNGTVCEDHEIHKLQKDGRLVLERVLERHSENLAVIAYSAGNASNIKNVAEAHKQGKVIAYVNLSMGARSNALVLEAEVAMNILQMPPEEFYAEGDLGKYFDELSDVPSLFICGDKDFLTPQADLDYFLRRPTRKDMAKPKGELKVLKGKHAFEHTEEGPANAIKEFFSRVLQT